MMIIILSEESGESCQQIWLKSQGAKTSGIILNFRPGIEDLLPSIPHLEKALILIGMTGKFKCHHLLIKRASFSILTVLKVKLFRTTILNLGSRSRFQIKTWSTFRKLFSRTVI
jgi:hypothetical protein